MEEDYFSDDLDEFYSDDSDGSGEYYSSGLRKNPKSFDFYEDKIYKIMKSTPAFIEIYESVFVSLDQKQLNELYKGKPITLNVKAKIKVPRNNVLNFITEDRSNMPSIIFISPSQKKNFQNIQKVLKSLN